MKPLICLAFLFSAIAGNAQSVTNLQVRAVAQLSDGTSTTNTATVNNANILTAIQNAIDTQNALRTNASPPQTAITNYSHFMIVSAAGTATQAQSDYDLRAAQKMVELLSVLTQAEKAQLRAIIAAH